MSEQWLTYPALAELWQISPEAARTRARRGQYQRRVGNDGQAEVLVDNSAPIRKPRPPRAGGQTRTPTPLTTPDAETPSTATAKALEALEAHVATLKDQLAKAEASTAAERERVADLTAQLLKLTVELLEARKADIRPRSWWARLVG
jgi:hypothetical protein